MRAQTVITIKSMPGDFTRVVFTSHLPGDRRPLIQASVELPKDGVRGFVLDLCQKAGLPRPW